MTRYRIIIDRYTYGRSIDRGFETGIEYAIQAYDEQDRQVYPASLRASPQTLDDVLNGVWVRMESRCDAFTPDQTSKEKS